MKTQKNIIKRIIVDTTTHYRRHEFQLCAIFNTRKTITRSNISWRGWLVE